MLGYITLQEASARSGRNRTWLQQCARNGRIEGAVQLNGAKGIWLLPENFKVQSPNELPDGYVSLSDAAVELRCTRQNAHLLCKQGKLLGAKMFGSRWGVPTPVVKVDAVRT